MLCFVLRNLLPFKIQPSFGSHSLVGHGHLLVQTGPYHPRGQGSVQLSPMDPIHSKIEASYLEYLYNKADMLEGCLCIDKTMEEHFVNGLTFLN